MRHKHNEVFANCNCPECRAAFSPRERYDAKQALTEAASLLVLMRLREAARDGKRSARIAARSAPKPTSGRQLARRSKAGEVKFYTVPA